MRESKRQNGLAEKSYPHQPSLLTAAGGSTSNSLTYLNFLCGNDIAKAGISPASSFRFISATSGRA
jgi:hypothetical protein